MLVGSLKKLATSPRVVNFQVDKKRRFDADVCADFPRAACARGFQAALGPGDVLLLPGDALHSFVPASARGPRLVFHHRK